MDGNFELFVETIDEHKSPVTLYGASSISEAIETANKIRKEFPEEGPVYLRILHEFPQDSGDFYEQHYLLVE